MEKQPKTRYLPTNLTGYLKLFWAQKWIIVAITGSLLMAGIVFALIWPKTYEATATVFPVSSSSTSSALSDYAGLASLAGISLPTSVGGGGAAGKKVNALLGSRLLVESVIKDLSLDDRIVVSGENANQRHRNLVDRLRKAVRSKEDSKTGVVSVTVELEDAALAQEISNRLLENLDSLLAEKSLTSNQKRRQLLNRQIEEQWKKLSDYQQQMATFQKETALLNPTAQAGKVVEAYTMLIQQKMELELQIATAQTSYSADNPRITALQTQLTNLEAQINTLKNQVGGDLPSMKMAPENLIRYQNLARDLEIATKIYAGLLASLEQSKLDSDQDQVYVEILDRALLPSDGKPSRSLVFQLFLVTGFLLSLLTVLAMEWVLRSGAASGLDR